MTLGFFFFIFHDLGIFFIFHDLGIFLNFLGFFFWDFKD